MYTCIIHTWVGGSGRNSSTSAAAELVERPARLLLVAVSLLADHLLHLRWYLESSV